MISTVSTIEREAHPTIFREKNGRWDNPPREKEDCVQREGEGGPASGPVGGSSSK